MQKILVGPKLETTLGAVIGEKDVNEANVIKNGEVIKYTVKVSNTGSEDVEDIKIEAKIPQGTKLVEPVENYEYTGTSYYEEVDTDMYKGSIDSLAVGETKYLEYELRVDKDLKEGTSIKNTVKI